MARTAHDTGVPLETLRDTVAPALVSLPPDFTLHRRVKKVQDDKAKALQEGKRLDWATAEALAFGSLMLEGHHVRLTGQDVERGTFSHRHAVVHCQKSGNTHNFLNQLIDAGTTGTGTKADSEDGTTMRREGWNRFEVRNSCLSEYGVLGYELGYSLDDPEQLVLWEAQFGDFANGKKLEGEGKEIF